MRLRLTLIILFTFPLLAKAQFKEGFIIDRYGQKYSGLIKFTPDEPLLFKESKKGKAETLTTNDIKAFVIEKDSFISVQYSKTPTTKNPIKGFAKVLIKGPDKILCTVSTYTASRATPTVGKWEKEHYLIKSNDKLYELTKSNFLKEMPLIVSDDTALKQQIQSRKLTFDDMEEIVRVYNSHR